MEWKRSYTDRQMLTVLCLTHCKNVFVAQTESGFLVAGSDDPRLCSNSRGMCDSGNYLCAYRFKSIGRGAASHHYNTMPLQEIINMPIASMCNKDCFLWLWVTNPIMAEGWHVDICKAWGFKPHTILTWVKRGIGMGYTLRSATEHILVARKGKPIVKNRGIPTWFEAKRLRHSEKPEDARTIIHKICDGPFLELFARKQTEGWDVFGNEVPNSIII